MESKEQRKTNRKLLGLRAAVLCSGAGGYADSTPVRTLNLSNAGALVESSEEMFANQICTFELATSDSRWVQVQGHIIWVKRDENGTYQAGVAFRNLSADEVYLLDLQLVKAR
jgi:hypothetical protein